MAPGQAHPFFRAGLPLLGLTIGGFLGLRFFLQGRLDVQVGGISCRPAADVCCLLIVLMFIVYSCIGARMPVGALDRPLCLPSVLSCVSGAACPLLLLLPPSASSCGAVVLCHLLE